MDEDGMAENIIPESQAAEDLVDEEDSVVDEEDDVVAENMVKRRAVRGRVAEKQVEDVVEREYQVAEEANNKAQVDSMAKGKAVEDQVDDNEVYQEATAMETEALPQEPLQEENEAQSADPPWSVVIRRPKGRPKVKRSSRLKG
jgi:hypothetical protein